MNHKEIKRKLNQIIEIQRGTISSLKDLKIVIENISDHINAPEEIDLSLETISASDEVDVTENNNGCGLDRITRFKMILLIAISLFTLIGLLSFAGYVILVNIR